LLNINSVCCIARSIYVGAATMTGRKNEEFKQSCQIEEWQTLSL
jgi:hypothetical protein